MDSVIFIEKSPTSIANFVTSNFLVQILVKCILLFYYTTTFPLTWMQYGKAGKYLHQNPQQIPTLILYSRNDSISNASKTDKLIESWRSMGIQMRTKCWNESEHVQHFRMHPKEYEQEVDGFLSEVLELPFKKM